MAVVEIKLDQLKIHPNNIRKEYEGIDELAQSIKEKGILQNLTVVPDEKEKGTYFVVIGNRRLTAAREAGIKTAPCVIVENMDDREQIMTMLAENMNRKNLKIYEEAAAIQMCFGDFGFKMEELQEKTGLSKTTLYHRLNVAKLDAKELKKRAKDEEFALTINDLYALEKIEDVKTRNKILKEATNSRDIAYRAAQAAREELWEKHKKELISLCKKAGIEPAPKAAEREFYSDKWKQLKEYNLNNKVPEEIDVKASGELFYLLMYSRLYIIKRVVKKGKSMTAEELKRKEREKRQREIKKKYKELVEDMGNFIRKQLEIKNPAVELDINIGILDANIWEFLLQTGSYIGNQMITEALLGKKLWNASAEEREAAEKTAKTLPMIWQKLAVAYNMMPNLRLEGYYDGYNKADGEKVKKFYKILQQLDYAVDDEMLLLITGEHNLYNEG